VDSALAAAAEAVGSAPVAVVAGGVPAAALAVAAVVANHAGNRPRKISVHFLAIVGQRRFCAVSTYFNSHKFLSVF
jgi:hypothetical protein